MPQHFDLLRGEARAKEVARTRRVIGEILALRPRSEFPAVAVIYNGHEVRPHVVDAAFTAARLARQRSGAAAADWPWLASIELSLHAASNAEAARIAAGEPLPMRDGDGTRKADEAAAADLPRGDAVLVAPLVFGADHA